MENFDEKMDYRIVSALLNSNDFSSKDYVEVEFHLNKENHRIKNNGEFEEITFLVDEYAKLTNRYNVSENQFRYFTDLISNGNLKVNEKQEATIAETIFKTQIEIKNALDYIDQKRKGYSVYSESMKIGNSSNVKETIALLWYIGFFGLPKIYELTQLQRNKLVSKITGKNPNTLSAFIKAYMNPDMESYSDRVDKPKEIKEAEDYFNSLKTKE